MITFKPLVTYRRKDGTYAVRIRVTFRRQHRYLATTMTAYPQQLTRSLRLKDPALVASAEALIRDLRELVAELNPLALEGRTVDWVVAWIRQRYADRAFRLDFFEFAVIFLRQKRPGTAAVYHTALRAFSRFLGSDRIDVNDITRPMLQRFLKDAPPIRGDVRGEGANARQLALLGAIYAAAQRQYNDGDDVRIPRRPFDGLDLRLPHSKGQKALSVDVMQKIISARPADPREAVALAAFVVSFGTMGANLADLWSARKFSGEVWIYERQKTRERRQDRARMEVEVDDRIAYHLEILEGPGPWWLPQIHRGTRPNTALQWIGPALRSWAVREGLPEFTFYAARHSWATIARSLGVEKATVDEGLAHIGDFRVADIYAERDWKRINDANRRVLDCFSWEGCGA